MFRRQSSALPAWFWFIPAFLLSLIAVLYWQRDKLLARPGVASRLAALRRPAFRRPAFRRPTFGRPAFGRSVLRPALRRPRYVEPDSIPIHLRAVPEFILPPEPLEAALASAEVLTAPAQPEPVPAPGAPADLKRIEGIGPAIARLLFEHGIVDFWQLAETPVERLDEILRAANLRRLADPGTWSEQARYAAAGDWEGLKQLQATLKGGRRVAG